jgi:hypothetical protein
MDNPILLRTAQSGGQLLSFQAAVLAAGTTKHPGSTRWTEMTVYRLQKQREEPPQGGYVVAKVGRSLVVHSADCGMARPKMMTHWDATNSDNEWRVPCLVCNPSLSRQDRTTWLEQDRHSVLQARNPAALVDILLGETRAVRGMTAEVIRQLRLADNDFDRWWTDEVAPKLMKDDA